VSESSSSVATCEGGAHDKRPRRRRCSSEVFTTGRPEPRHRAIPVIVCIAQGLGLEIQDNRHRVCLNRHVTASVLKIVKREGAVAASPSMY
jgi:hypothetical protein